jgi:hypothetical protein
MIMESNFKNKPRHRRSSYEKYICMAHTQTHQLGISYSAYLIFMELIKILEVISNTASDSNQYLYVNELYNKKITQSDALTILDNIYNGKWNATTAKCILVANQVGLNIK